MTSEEYPIEHGIPIPTQRCGTVRPAGCINPKPPAYQRPRSVFPFLRLRVSDSFFVKATKEAPVGTIQARLANRAWYHAKLYGMVYVTRRYDDGVRCWRIE